MLLQSVALRLLESSSAWWLVTVPEGSERAVGNELMQELIAQGGTVSLWPGQEPGSEPVSLLIVAGSALQELPVLLDSIRGTLAKSGVVAFIVAESRAGDFLHDAPHVASFVAGHVVSTTAEDDDAPPEYIARRLESLRKAYGMSDEAAREAYRAGRAPDDLHFLEWMILLGDDSGRNDAQ